MIKRVLVLVMAAAVMFFCGSCAIVSFTSVGSDRIAGKGPMTTVEYSLGQYKAVEIYNDMELYYTAGQSDKVVIELQENLAEHLDISVEEGVLMIKSDKWFVSEEGKTPKLHISAPVLEKIAVVGGVDIKQADTIKADSFVLDVSGAINGDLSIETDTLDVDISGACSLTLSGSARSVGIQTAGASSVDAIELKTKQADIEVDGTGNISISCSDTLNVESNGVGNITYKGNPEVTKNTSGAFSVNRLAD